jgi:nucleoid DNA-binding protein
LIDKELKFIFTKMDILQYLIKLVENQKEVGVAGLGTFYKKKSPGRYDVNIHSFIPPSLVLHFKQEVTEEDILKDYISKERNISKNSAHYFIQQFSEDLNKQLEVDKKVALGSLGTLAIVEGTITLSSGSAPDAGIDFYGLPLIPEDTSLKPVPFLKEVSSSENTSKDVLSPNHSVELVSPSSENSSHDVLSPDHSVQHVSSPSENASKDLKQDGSSIKPESQEQTKPNQDELKNTETFQAEDFLTESPLISIAGSSNDINSEPAKTEVEELEHVFLHPDTVQDRIEEPVRESITNDSEDPILASIIEENSLEEENPGESTSYLPPINRVNDIGPISVERERNEIPLYLKIILAVLVLFVAFFAFYFLYPNTINNFNKSSDRVDPSTIRTPADQETPQTTIDSTANDTSGRSVTPILDTTAKVDSVTKTPETSSLPLTETDTTQITYEVIGSSPYRLSEAEQFIHAMKVKHGLQAKIVSQRKGKKIKISVASFKTKKQAELEVPILKKKLGIKGLYTYTNTHKPD